MKAELHYGEANCPLMVPDNFPKDDELHFEIEMLDFFKVKARKSFYLYLDFDMISNSSPYMMTYVKIPWHILNCINMGKVFARKFEGFFLVEIKQLYLYLILHLTLVDCEDLECPGTMRKLSALFSSFLIASENHLVFNLFLKICSASSN